MNSRIDNRGNYTLTNVTKKLKVGDIILFSTPKKEIELLITAVDEKHQKATARRYNKKPKRGGKSKLTIVAKEQGIQRMLVTKMIAVSNRNWQSLRTRKSAVTNKNQPSSKYQPFTNTGTLSVPTPNEHAR